ncbi:MAG: 50S ribosomal protein L25 [Candidatus Parcubacteria bacterium]|nr:50S ribosomal protein L25 [Candidatus Parcubacteria bacterium]
MLSLQAKIRKIIGAKTKTLRQKGVLPVILYGPKTKSVSLEVQTKDFEKAYKEAGQSSLISLEIEGDKEKNLALIQNIQWDSITGGPKHADFYQPDLTKKIQALVPIVLEGIAPAVKDLGGTLVTTISEVFVKALPQDLPKEIRASVETLKTFEDNIFIKDLKIGNGIEILKHTGGEIVARVTHPEKVDEELAKPVVDNVGEVERVGDKKKEEEAIEEAEEKKKPAEAKAPKEEKKS